MTDHPSPTVGELGEQYLLERFAAAPVGGDVLVGPGDDCAVCDTGGLRLTLLKTDCVVGGVHFTLDEDFRRVGHKALARAISDIGSMGGTPRHALVTLMMPPSTTLAQVDALYAGLRAVGERFGVQIVGGETTSAPPPHRDALMVNIALTGDVDRDHVTTRAGGQPGDALFVTGVLGGSIAGHHLDFIPRLAEGQWLAANGATAMMDLSDGLAKDLPRLAKASGCEAHLDLTALPLRGDSTPTDALNDGEDFELLVAVPEDRVHALLITWRSAFPDTRITRIGRLVEPGSADATPLHGGFDHFSG